MVLSLAMSRVDQGMVLIAITLLVAPIAAFAFSRSGAVWRRVGGGRFAIERPAEPKPGEAPSPEAEHAEREAEVRQMVEAQSHRRKRRGEAPLDVDAEVKRRLADLSE
jgi:hypothetical protein